MFKYRKSNIARIYAKFSAGLSVALVLSSFCCATANSEEILPSGPADVRLVIDVSGSMKRNDPNNLRQPAVELLVQLLPEGSKAGVWTFGKWVNMLVPHREVDEAWRETALSQAKNINSLGLYTNIGEALEKATHDSLKSSGNFHTSVILLTDGMVDIAKSPEVNQKEWRRIVDQVLPDLQSANYTVHTIALSGNADTNLMTKLSLATDGIAEVAHTAEDLMRIFLKAFDAAAPAEQVPLSDNQFVIDSSVEEFTALIFRKNPSEQTQLIGPDGDTFSADNTGSDIKWHRADNYDLVTVKRPLEGEWGLKVDMAPDSRVTVVSNLNLRVAPLPNNIIKGHSDQLILSLREDGHTIERMEFLRLMDINASMEAGNDEFTLAEFWRETLSNPEKGVYQKALPRFDKDGIYQLNVIVDGKSFVRQFNHQFNVRPAFDARVQSVFKDGKLEYQIIASSYSADVKPSETQVVASVAAPGGRKKIIPLKATGQDTWQANLLPDKEGEYSATIKAKGMTNGGESFTMELEPISFVYSADKGFVEAEEPFFEESKKSKGAPEKKDRTEDSAIEETASSEAENEPVKNEDASSQQASNWILYGALAVGNLLLFALGYFAYRKIMGGQSADQVLEKYSDENIEQEDGEPLEQESTDEEMEEEPPMEDLDIAEEVADTAADEPVAEIEEDDEDLDPVAESEPEIEPELESLLEPEPEAELTPEMQADGDVSSVSDDFDDLEQMAMEAVSQESESEKSPQQQEYPVEPEDDDMVSEMLKAQGLDLAEEELDDAISSLIDDLQDGEEGKG